MIKDTAQNVVATIFQRHLGVVVSAMSDELVLVISCVCAILLVALLSVTTITSMEVIERRRTGTGRWDYQDRHLP